MNLVRIPVGYWATKDSTQAFPHPNISLEFLDKAFDVCDELGLAIIVDLHGARDSQNGWDHSGWARDKEHWTDDWEKNSKDTIESIVFLTERYNKRESFFGIEVLNEPIWTIPLEKLGDFYWKCYENIRKINENVLVIMSDSFRGYAIDAETFIPKVSKVAKNVMIDVHSYQCFTEEDKKLSTEGHLQKVTIEWTKMMRSLKKNNMVICGEWSLGINWKSFVGMQQEEIKEWKRIYFMLQKNTWEEGDGGVFWSWRLGEKNYEWSMEILYKDGYIE